MLRTTGIYFIILVMILVKCFLPGENRRSFLSPCKVYQTKVISPLIRQLSSV